MSAPSRQPIASYQADPEQVARVLLLYSGGLDTSVMLHWIQQQYGAEVVTLTVELGRPSLLLLPSPSLKGPTSGLHTSSSASTTGMSAAAT